MATYNINRETGDLIPVSGGTLYADNPVGTILPYGGSVAPAGWFICDGSALNRTTYAELFSVIGTKFGVGDGSTTFNIPDMREAVPKGAGLTGKSVGSHVSTNGLSVGEFIDDRIQNHQHLLKYRALGSTGGNTNVFTPSTTGADDSNTFNVVSARYDNTTEVKSIGVNYIIKAQRVAVPADFMASVHEAMNDSVVTEVTGSGDTNCGFRAHKKNGIVSLWMLASGVVQEGVNHSFGLLPVGYRPYGTIRITGYDGNSTDYTTSSVLGAVTADGGISLSCKYIASSRTLANATFIAEN